MINKETTQKTITEEYVINANWETKRTIIIEQAKAKNINDNELATLISALDDTDGLLMSSDIRPKGLTRNQVKGYISALSKKGIFDCSGGDNEYPDFVNFIIELDNGDIYYSGQDDSYWVEKMGFDESKNS